jgi:hypothetical protein
MIDEQFRRWMMAPVSMPSAPQELHTALSETEDLPEMIEIVREAEIACMRQLRECNRQMRPAGEASDPGEWARTIQLLVSHREVMELDMRIKWLQDVRRSLEKQQQRSEIACVPLR